MWQWILIYFFFAILVVMIVFLLWQITAYHAPQPEYKVVISEGNIDVRKYPALLVAEVDEHGERYAAINAGFRVLADYIFGNNHSQATVSMTAPVIQESVRIDMTAPVIQQKDARGWKVRFIMPSSYTLHTLPKPNNAAVKVLEIPARTYVVIRFAGSNSDGNLDSHAMILHDYIRQHGLQTLGEPVYAFYNPPWILPMLRRNEIMVEVKE